MRLKIGLLMVLIASCIGLACSGSDQQQIGNNAISAAKDSGRNVGSYSSTYASGIGEINMDDAPILESLEFHRPETIVNRSLDGKINYVAAQFRVFRPTSPGTWCSIELDRVISPDLLAEIPDRIDQVVHFRKLSTGQTLIEGFSQEIDEMSFSNDPAVVLHRLIMNPSGEYFDEWVNWWLPSLIYDEYLELTQSELIELSDGAKDGPWTRYQFRDIDNLTPVAVPDQIVGACK